MDANYREIGRRIARRRKQLGLKQSEVEELADIGYKYLSNIERGISIPSIEVILRLSAALDTTPDEFLVGTAHTENEDWKQVAQLLSTLSPAQLKLARSLLVWLSEQELA
ncbi:MAG TPA: XRE family transcriptional regulator [Clostridiales bacterium]|nr:XRE family transcriptional regulator [Clostridiales bacterium]